MHLIWNLSSRRPKNCRIPIDRFFLCLFLIPIFTHTIIIRAWIGTCLHTAVRPRLASSWPVNRRPMRGDDLERQDVDSKRRRLGSGTFNGKATRLLMSHKVMFVVLRECVCVFLVRVLFYVRQCTHRALVCFFLSFLHVCVCACTHLMDREQTKRVREAPIQLIQCVMRPRWVLQQQLLAQPTSHVPKMADGLNNSIHVSH